MQFGYIVSHQVGSIPTPLKNMSSSIGMMILKLLKKQTCHVPNYQPAIATLNLFFLQTREGLKLSRPGQKRMNPGQSTGSKHQKDITLW